MPVQYLLPALAGGGDDAVPVAHGGGVVRGLVHGLAYLLGEGAQLPHGGVLLEDDLPVLLCIDLEGVTATDNVDAKTGIYQQYAAFIEKNLWRVTRERNGCFQVKSLREQEKL